MPGKTKAMQELIQIQAELRQGKSITQLEALDMFGCMRLGARIWDLRHKLNIPIKTTTIEINGKQIAKYSLEDELQS